MTEQAAIDRAVQAKKVRVLLIEDNPADARLVEIYLKESTMLDSEIVKAKELKEGLQYLEEEEFDVILLDLTLPDSQGFNTIKTMIEEFPEYTIIVMTGMDDETIALNSVKAGAQDFIVKGQFDSNLLGRTISYAIERHQMTKRIETYAKAIKQNEKRLLEAQKMSRIGNWELDIVTNKMYWSEEVFRILGYEDQNFEPTISEYLEPVESSEVELVKTEINRTMEKGAQYNIEYRVNLKNGTSKVVANQGQIQMSQKSGSIVLVGTIQDISSFRSTGESANDAPTASSAPHSPVLGEAKQIAAALATSSLNAEDKALVRKLINLLDRA
ncbi:MAG: two-component system sensor histidine kinase UhpB [Limisphaerales bacterium]|jgi:two-component system sensor histidine kinase UhpB